jgi:hypothetical protein
MVSTVETVACHSVNQAACLRLGRESTVRKGASGEALPPKLTAKMLSSGYRKK